MASVAPESYVPLVSLNPGGEMPSSSSSSFVSPPAADQPERDTTLPSPVGATPIIVISPAAAAPAPAPSTPAATATAASSSSSSSGPAITISVAPAESSPPPPSALSPPSSSFSSRGSTLAVPGGGGGASDRPRGSSYSHTGFTATTLDIPATPASGGGGGGGSGGGSSARGHGLAFDPAPRASIVAAPPSMTSSRPVAQPERDRRETDRVYKKLDRKKDAKVDAEELGYAIVALGLPPQPFPQLQAMASALDVRSMGGIHLDEFKKVRIILNGGQFPPIIEEDDAKPKSVVVVPRRTGMRGMDEHLSEEPEPEDPSQHRAAFRQLIGQFLEHRYMVRFIVFILTCDIIRFLLYLLMKQGIVTTEAADPLLAVSIVILLYFAVEVVFLIIAFGGRAFLHAGYLIDIIIVPVSLALELSLSRYGGFFVIARSWRIVQALRAYDISQRNSAVKKEKFKEAIATVQRKFDALMEILQKKQLQVEEGQSLLECLIKRKNGDLGATPRLVHQDTVIKPSEKQTDVNGPDGPEVMRIFDSIDRDQDGVINYKDLILALGSTLGGPAISVSDAQAKSIIGIFSGTGHLNLKQLSTFRDLFNGNFKSVHPLVDPLTFDKAIEEEENEVESVLYQENEDPELDNNFTSKAPLEPYLPNWRRQLLSFMQSNAVMISIAILMVLDVIRFFLDLMNLEGDFGSVVSTEMDDVLNIIGISILSFFLFEVALNLLALQELFFSDWGFVGDLIIVPISLFVEAAYHGIGGFLVFARLWRLFRVVRKVANESASRMARGELREERVLVNYQNNFYRLVQKCIDTHKELLAVEKESARLKIAAGVIPSSEPVYLLGSPRTPATPAGFK